MFGGTVHYYTDLAKFRKAMKRKIGDDPGRHLGGRLRMIPAISMLAYLTETPPR